MIGLFKRLGRFIKYNKHKKISIEALFYSAFYRLQILTRKPKSLQKHWGIEGEESIDKETEEIYRYAGKVAYAVDRVCTKTKWESKCLVRALTAGKLLRNKHIHYTLYLGCGKEDGKLVAHAWLRCGRMYVTGGNGAEYAMVSKFKN